METTRTTLPRTATDPRPLFAKAVGTASQVIAGVGPEQLVGPTPCGDMDVRQLMVHLVEVLQRVAALGRGEDPFHLPAAEPVRADAWSAAVQQVHAVWTDDSVLDREMTLPWIQAPGSIVLLAYVSEVTVHTWDLARATGQAPKWDPEVLEAAYAGISGALPAEGRQAAFDAVAARMPPELATFAPPFAEAVPVPADAPLIDRLVAWTGRRP